MNRQCSSWHSDVISNHVLSTSAHLYIWREKVRDELCKCISRVAVRTSVQRRPEYLLDVGGALKLAEPGLWNHEGVVQTRLVQRCTSITRGSLQGGVFFAVGYTSCGSVR